MYELRADALDDFLGSPCEEYDFILEGGYDYDFDLRCRNCGFTRNFRNSRRVTWPGLKAIVERHVRG